MPRYHSFFCCKFFKLFSAYPLSVFPHYFFLIIVSIPVIVLDDITENTKGGNAQANILAGLIGLGVRAVVPQFVVNPLFKPPATAVAFRHLGVQARYGGAREEPAALHAHGTDLAAEGGNMEASFIFSLVAHGMNINYSSQVSKHGIIPPNPDIAFSSAS